MNQMTNILKSRYSLLNWYLSLKSEILLQEGNHRIEFFAHLISDMFNNFTYEEKKQKDLLAETVKFSLDEIRSENINYYFKEISKNIFQIEEYIDLFSIHGSYSDNSYKIGWSDVDTFLIINRKSCKDPSSLLEIRKICISIEKLFLKICPLQHHGVISIGADDLELYDSHYLPIPVVESSKHIYRRKQPIKYSQNNKVSGAYYSLLDRYKHIKAAEKSGIYMHHPFKQTGLPIEHKKLSYHMYQLFCFLGYLMTSPAYFLDAIGKPTTKKDSFSKISDYFSYDQLEIIFIASEIRKIWPEKIGIDYQLNYIPQWLLKTLPKDYFQKSKLLFELFLNKISEVRELN